MEREPNTALLLTPPFVQLNAPYAAVPFLAGTLEHHGYPTLQRDLSLAVALRLFSPEGLDRAFAIVPPRILPRARREAYRATISSVISLLQGKAPSLAERILSRRFLPEGPRFRVLDESPAAARLKGTERALYLASLYLDDLVDVLQRAIPSFGLSRYGERLAHSPATFDALRRAAREDDLVARFLSEELATLPWNELGAVAVTIPFPGTLLGALRIGRFVKEHHPKIPVIFGGGYVNTELRDLRDHRFFEFCDHLVLDDGEAPLRALLDHLERRRKVSLVRTFVCEEKKVRFIEGKASDLWGRDLGIPRYETGELDRYLDLAETPNPMHRLWSRRDTLKIRLTHGCHWHRCAFCDTTLPHISRYRPLDSAFVVEQMAHLSATTGRRLFHLVDEALPPVLLRRFAEEILRCDLKVSWWGNIRFEKGFDAALSRLLKKSGCVAFTGGLEGVTDRMLALMRKGITIAEAVRALAAIRDAGIMTHAYLIYGFPGQDQEETLNGLEIVRQLFKSRLLMSAYYHRFALTVHSTAFAEQEVFGISAPRRKSPFANNDIAYREEHPSSADLLGPGLHKAIYNYMHGNLIDAPVQTFFDQPVPRPSVSRRFVTAILQRSKEQGS